MNPAPTFSTRPTRTLVSALMSFVLGVGGLSLLSLASQAAQPNRTSPVDESQELSLYGQAPQPNQVNRGYVVFEQQGDTVLGAYYYPKSEFECFVGKLNDKTDTLSGMLLASMQDGQSPVNIGLSPLYELKQTSENDLRMIKHCKQSVINQIQNGQLPTKWQALPSALLR